MAKGKTVENEIINLAALVGTGLLESRAETYRVEESMQCILESYSEYLSNIQVFAITHYFILSADDREGKTIVVTRNVRDADTNLNKVDLLNNITRMICQHAPEPKEALKEVEEILALPRYSLPIYTGAVALTGFSFTLLLGASILPAIWAALVSSFLMYLVIPLQKLGGNRLFINIIRGFMVYLLLYPVVFTQYAAQIHLMIAGSFMYLFPGILLVNSIRDLISIDYLAGLIKLIETILSASAIAVGTGIASAVLDLIFRSQQGLLPSLDSINPSNPLSFMIATLAVFAFMLIFDVRRILPLLAGSVGGGICWLIYAFASQVKGFNFAIPVLLATLFLAAYSELMARLTKKPATVYLTAGLYTIVPGYEIYRAMNFFITAQQGDFINSIMRAFFITGTLALGIMIVSAIARLYYSKKSIQIKT